MRGQENIIIDTDCDHNSDNMLTEMTIEHHGKARQIEVSYVHRP